MLSSATRRQPQKTGAKTAEKSAATVHSSPAWCDYMLHSDVLNFASYNQADKAIIPLFSDFILPQRASVWLQSFNLQG